VLAATADSSGSGEFWAVEHKTTVNILPEDVLLEIFDFYQIESNPYLSSLRPVSDWFRLVHVCRRWRQIVLVSPRRLDLTLFCTYGTPVRKNLGSLPPFPIIVDYLTFSDLRSPAPNHEDDIIAALDHPDRVRSIKLAVTNYLFGVVSPLMQEPFIALETLWLSSKDQNSPVLPDIFLTGPAPQLRQIFLEGISFPALPTILSSASNLVDLQLKDVPQSGYISPEVMATSLAALNRLNTLCIWFKAPISRTQLRSSPASMRHVLLSLVTFKFYGSSEYLEDLLAQLETPRLRVINITYFHQLDFQVPQLFQFIHRTGHLKVAQSPYTQGCIRISSRYVELDFEDVWHQGGGFTLCISCKWPDWQVLHLAQILAQSPAFVSNVDHLSIDENHPQLEQGWKDGLDDTDWLELLRPFTAVRMLHGPKKLAENIAHALDGVGGEMITEVLPTLASLSLEDQPVKSVEKFLTARRIYGHLITFVDTGMCEFTSCASFLDCIISDSSWLRNAPEGDSISSSSSFIADRHGAKHHGPTDLFVDGFIARTFATEDAESYFTLLLGAPPSKHFLQSYGIVYHLAAWYVTRNSNLVQRPSPGVPQPTPLLLDYSVTARGAVVPQRRWTPTSKVAFRNDVENQHVVLQLPVFFVNRNGELGFWFPHILQGCDRDLQNANDPAPLGGKTTTHIRINVSLSPSHR
jgi:hypothetical protein